VQVPYGALTPRASDTANLFCPVPASFTHVAYSTYRLEPQYAVFGHACGTAAALALRTPAKAVQDVNVTELRALLLSQKQNLGPGPAPPAALPFGCSPALKRCVGLGTGGGYPNATCSGECSPLGTGEWLANTCCELWTRSGSTLTANKATYLKKSTADSSALPAAEKLSVKAGASCRIVAGSGELGQYMLCADVR
jgi:hypothetical protein